MYDLHAFPALPTGPRPSSPLPGPSTGWGLSYYCVILLCMYMCKPRPILCMSITLASAFTVFAASALQRIQSFPSQNSLTSSHPCALIHASPSVADSVGLRESHISRGAKLTHGRLHSTK